MIIHPFPEGDEYESVQEMVDQIKIGIEIEFKFAGKEWAILPQVGNYCIYEKHNEESYREFATIEEMLDGYKFDDKPLRDVVTDLKVIWH